MPSPTCSTVPTSDRLVSTSKSSMRCLRMDVISSGLSFKATPSLSRCEFTAQPLEAATKTGVEAQRSHLEDDSSEQFGLDAPGGIHVAAAGALDLLDDLTGLVVRQLDRGRELEREPPGRL